MAVIATDTFTRANGPLAGSVTETGALTWELMSTSTGWSIASGKVGGPTNHPDGMNMSIISVPAPFGATVTADLTATASQGMVGISLGPSGAGGGPDGVALVVEYTVLDSYFQIHLVRLAGTTFVSSIPLGDTAPGFATGTPGTYSLTVTDAGVIKASFNGVEIYTGTPWAMGAAPWRAGLCTLQSYVGSCKVDNFEVANLLADVTGSAPVAIGTSAAVDLIAAARTATGDSPVNVATSGTASPVPRTVASGGAPVTLGSTSASTGRTPLSGWVADTSQRSLLEVTTDSGELDYTPPAQVGSGPESLPPEGVLALPPPDEMELLA